MALSYVGFRFRRTLSGGSPAKAELPLASGTYYDGNVLKANTSGSAALVTAGTTVASYVMIGNATKATVDASPATKYSMYIVNEDNVFEARMLVSVAPQTKVTDLAGLAIASTYNHRLMGTVGMFRVIGYHPDEALTAHTNGRFFVTGARSQYAAASRTTE